MVERLRDDVIARLGVTALLAAHLLIDAVFLALCAVVGWALEKCVFRPLSLDGFDGWFLWSIRILTGLALFVAVANAVVEDIIVAVKQTIRRVREQEKQGK